MTIATGCELGPTVVFDNAGVMAPTVFFSLVSWTWWAALTVAWVTVL